ncbi:pentapeptide repeat-containing protein [Streptomyces sp. NPDC059828]|uniref:pentapeptide repeat-containing protein n=1 Tax=Streptomyces sp. NPDC059828 TaxID=3346965 RepID=UPI003650A7B3
MQFDGDAVFSGAQFSGDTWFDQAQFGGVAAFRGAQFSGSAQFNETRFSGSAYFNETQFSVSASFDQVQFSGIAWFRDAQFPFGAWFGGAQFSGDTQFDLAQFSELAWFRDAQFSSKASFCNAQFSCTARFDQVQFFGDAQFASAQFPDGARFGGAQFSGDAWFGGAQFSRSAWFDGVRFEGVSVLGPLVCAERVVLSGAVFVLPVTLEIAAATVVCARTRWESTAVMRLRYADVDLGHAVLTAPTAVVVHPTPFTHEDSAVGAALLTGADPQNPRPPDRVRVLSVQGVDAAHLVLTDTDLTACLFSGAFHLDQIRLEGRTTFDDTPRGRHWRGIRPIRYTRRRTLAEEHHWRAHTLGEGSGWHRPDPPDPAHTSDSVDVAALYRQLRKAFEDGKNEPGAADFYYGESEMRRHDLTGTAKGERRLLWGYWLLSGYGLRASRAFTWLFASMTLTVLLLMGVGLPSQDPDPATRGTVHGSKISLTTKAPDAVLEGKWPQRWSWKRAEKATRVAVNSVVFRSSGQNLTTAGTYIEMTSRLLEPTLLALGVLAIRGRIKR